MCSSRRDLEEVELMVAGRFAAEDRGDDQDPRHEGEVVPARTLVGQFEGNGGSSMRAFKAGHGDWR